MTKTVCVTALANLVDDSTAGHLTNEGVVQTLSKLCKQPDPSSPDPTLLRLCIVAFNLLSNYDEAKISIAEKSSTLISLFGTYDVCADDASRVICARTVANLVKFEPVHTRVLEAGALRILEQGARLADEEASLDCILAIFLATTSTAKFRQLVARSLIPSVVAFIASSCYGEKYDVCVKTLSVLACYENSRIFVQSQDLFSSGMIILTEAINEKSLNKLMRMPYLHIQ